MGKFQRREGRLTCGNAPRHHTIVHQKGHTATVTAATVTWHLQLPRPPTRHTRRDASARPDHG
jgi:hypothetical protein